MCMYMYNTFARLQVHMSVSCIPKVTEICALPAKELQLPMKCCNCYVYHIQTCVCMLYIHHTKHTALNCHVGDLVESMSRYAGDI